MVGTHNSCMLAVNETVMVAAVFVVDTGYMASTVAADLARES